MPSGTSITVYCAILSLGFGATASITLADENYEAVCSRVSSGYAREKQSDGSIKPESYSFGKGGYWGGPMPDTSMDRMSFTDILKVLVAPLAQQKYVPSRNQRTTKLLIMVYWGTTLALEKATDSIAHQQAERNNQDVAAAQSQLNADQLLAQFGLFPNEHIKEQTLQQDGQALGIATDQFLDSVAAVNNENQMRLQEDLKIAELLGYDSWWESTMGAREGTSLASRRKDMLDELEHYRYFVVLMAYDFQLMAKEKKHKLLWETRFSIRQQNNQFDKQLASMVLEASQYFGRDSKGLTHKALPQGHVEIKEPSLIELGDSKR